MWSAYLTYAGTLAACLWVGTRREPNQALLPVFLSGLWAMPVFIVGNSASAGVFPVDVVTAVFLLSLGFQRSRTIWCTAKHRGAMHVFLSLIAWVLITAVIACFDEPAVRRFAVYGVARWVLYLALILVFFGVRDRVGDSVKRLSYIGYVMAAYGTASTTLR